MKKNFLLGAKMKKTIKVKFLGISEEIIKTTNLYKIMDENYQVILCDAPDFVFAFEYCQEIVNYDCVRILILGENLRADFNLYDYAIGFDYMEFEDRYYRIPLYVFQDNFKRALSKHTDYIFNSQKEKAFCNMVVSNGNDSYPQRNDFYELLSTYKQVDSGGRYRNNVGGPVPDKLKFQQQYKFTIAFENAATNGYVTEKLIDAWAAGTIPIYWGSPVVGREFNAKAFINCHDYPNFEKVLERVREIDQNDDLYQSIMTEPITDKQFESFQYAEADSILKALSHIFDQEPDMAFRRTNRERGWGKLYEIKIRQYNDMEKLKLVRIAYKIVRMFRRH